LASHSEIIEILVTVFFMSGRLRWKVMASGDGTPIHIHSVVVVPRTTSIVVEGCGVTFLMLSVGWIEQLVEVEIL